MQFFSVLISTGLRYSPHFAKVTCFLLTITDMLAQYYCQEPVCIQVLFHTTQPLTIIFLFTTFHKAPWTYLQPFHRWENNNTTTTKWSCCFGDVLRLLSTWTEKKLENLRLYHEMVLSPFCKKHLEYHQSQESLLELGTDTPSLSTHRRLGS